MLYDNKAHWFTILQQNISYQMLPPLMVLELIIFVTVYQDVSLDRGCQVGITENNSPRVQDLVAPVHAPQHHESLYKTLNSVAALRNVFIDLESSSWPIQSSLILPLFSLVSACSVGKLQRVRHKKYGSGTYYLCP